MMLLRNTLHAAVGLARQFAMLLTAQNPWHSY
jgi:hypothetical protein